MGIVKMRTLKVRDLSTVKEYIHFFSFVFTFSKSCRHTDIYLAIAKGWRNFALVNSPCPDDKSSIAK